ncbi:hypothetical protein HanXRQr2_Chr01g0036861 [Helianthus annuus]|uniref:Uncharacterized protein n=1 Tax=Helianthus annuus TaxID=4232 RepID=A0A9K3JX29_HELAN|nr:hypothetical protein HanXRQr2_Chr01g0036861 [Helianthus annuus]KAJ0612671.1 hypothetical protein HanHA300_Chr01g0030011 [Helianthus annuus]KAJ0624212.1 hypothetical protein HanIR_Chr01g0040721 [Helianthus annuus]KAJ0628031.1 hypothetical protein HanHA89_Chr01g0032321 [Helianthus annuus]KAJ0784327.1 hypothetical protein HanLR1_Chr01g0030871 [Helianthus annuus]
MLNHHHAKSIYTKPIVFTPTVIQNLPKLFSWPKSFVRHKIYHTKTIYAKSMICKIYIM